MNNYNNNNVLSLLETALSTIINQYFFHSNFSLLSQLGAVEYTNCFSAEE